MLALSTLLLPGCLLRGAEARELLATGFLTPEATLRTFQTGLRASLPDLEYRCFSTSFRRREHISLFTYAEARERILAEKPWLSLFARAKVERSTRTAADRHELLATVYGHTVRIELVREDVFELRSGDELLTDGEIDLERAMETGGGALTLRVPLDDDVDVRELAHVSIERQWKIDSLVEVADP